MERVNQQTMERLASLADDDLPKQGTHRGYGPVTVQSSLMIVLSHRRGHVFQSHSNIVSLRAQREGRVPSEAYTVAGSGPTIVLLDAASSRWDAVAPLLAGSGYRVAQYKYAALPPDIEQLRNDLGADELWLAGTATGAIDAVKYALVHPRRTAGLVMVNMPLLPFWRDRADDFSSVTMPALTLAGEQHPHAGRLQERGNQFSGNRSAVIPGAGRDVPREQPQAVADAIRSFVPVAART
jgi:pimeloyl-ACP methyl ester carboxylesterase